MKEWNNFSIWSAGKLGRRLFRSLSAQNQEKVLKFCDVDVAKIGSFYEHQASDKIPKPKIKIQSFTEVKPPFLVAVKTNLHPGQS